MLTTWDELISRSGTERHYFWKVKKQRWSGLREFSSEFQPREMLEFDRRAKSSFNLHLFSFRPSTPLAFQRYHSRAASRCCLLLSYLSRMFSRSHIPSFQAPERRPRKQAFTRLAILGSFVFPHSDLINLLLPTPRVMSLPKAPTDRAYLLLSTYFFFPISSPSLLSLLFCFVSVQCVFLLLSEICQQLPRNLKINSVERRSF